MAVNGFILEQYVNKNVEIMIVNNHGILKGILRKEGRKFFLKRKFFLDNMELNILEIATIKEVEE